MAKSLGCRKLAVLSLSDFRLRIGTASGRDISITAMKFWQTTVIFALVGLVAAVVVRLSYSKGAPVTLLNLTLVITTTVCCWMMWAIVYLAQLNPLIVPVLGE